jgi:hypothetical protein
MTKYLLNLNEVERVKRAHNIDSITALAKLTKVSRATWSRVLNTQRYTHDTLEALANLGARPGHILITDD